MKKKTGFTLIELLSVIVILAIIALIAVPVIMDILDKSNKSAFKDTAYGILSAGELYFAEQQLDLNGMKEEKTFTLPSNEIQIKGNVPEGTILKVNAKGETALIMTNGRYCITKGYSDKDVIITEDLEYCGITSDGDDSESTPKTLLEIATTSTKLGVTSVHTCATSGTCEPGTAFAIKVNNTDTYKFRVLNDKNNVVTLIMSSNLYEEGDDEPDIEWLTIEDYEEETKIKLDEATNTYAPITALKALKERTTTWTNLEEYNYTLEDQYGTYADYSGEYVQNVRARLPRVSDITTDAIGCIEWETTCPDWIYEGLYNTGDNNTSGYWLSDASDIDPGSALGVDSDGTFIYAYVLVYRGVRPVIELSK